LDGIDVSGTNVWIHDVEVTNKDECVTIKVCLIRLIRMIAVDSEGQNPSSYMLVENIYCNWSGGSAMGSLSTGVGTNSHHCPRLVFECI
jgi:rhamnogalacturonan hydrolase